MAVPTPRTSSSQGQDFDEVFLRVLEAEAWTRGKGMALRPRCGLEARRGLEAKA